MANKLGVRSPIIQIRREDFKDESAYKRYAELLRGLQSARVSVNSKINELIDEILANDVDISALQTAVADNTSDIANNTSAIASNASAIASNDTDISNLQSAVASNDTDISNLQSAVSSNDTDISNLQSSVSTNTTNISGNASDISDIQSIIGFSSVSGFYNTSLGLYIAEDGYYGSSFDIDSSLTEATWESIGPTGSGADNIWSSLDIIPGEASMIILSANAQANPSLNSQLLVTLQGRANGDTVGTLMINSAWAIDDYSTGCRNASGDIFLPLDGNNIFESWWTANGDTSRSIVMYFRGFII